MAIADLLAKRVYLDGIIKEIPQHDYGNLLKDLCAFFKADNPLFKERVFRDYLNKKTKELSRSLFIEVKQHVDGSGLK